MPKRFVLFAIATLAALMTAAGLRAPQTSAAAPSGSQAGAAAGATNSSDESWKSEKWNTPSPPASYWETRRSAAAPKHDISGIWDAGGVREGVQPNGAYEYPDDPAYKGPDVPYTASGKQARAKNKPGTGRGQVAVAEVNDPVDYCDPAGMPRNDLFELRVVKILQDPNEVVILNQHNATWRIVWTDGRELPKGPAPRWFGYAVGKWLDDYTFVANYVGMDPRTWLDNVGRPHSDALKVEETWHRVNADTLELSVTIDDAKFYTHPWKAMNKFVLHRLPDDYDISEFICSATETAEYNRLVGKPVASAPTEGTNK